MAEVIISLKDSDDRENMEVTIHSSEMTDENSPANAIAEFLGASWPSVVQGAKMYGEAVRQARLEAASIAANGVEPKAPQLLKADGSGFYEPSGD